MKILGSLPLALFLVFGKSIFLSIFVSLAIIFWLIYKKRLLLALLTFPIVILFSFIITVVMPAHPSDKELEENFNKNEDTFNQLIKMFNEDNNLSRIAYNFTWLNNDISWPREEVGINNERWNEYKKIFDKLNLESGILRPMSPNNVVFLLSSSDGLVTGGSSKGYAYSESELSPLLNTLDKTNIDLKSNQYVYKKLKDNWYLFYIWDD